MSMGLVWRDSLNNLRNPAIETDSVKRHRDSLVLVSYRRDLETSLDSVVAQGHDPLLVVAAGNNPIDARWTGFETTTHANRILHVGSSNIADGVSSFSSIGPLVEIAAPGEGVYVLWGNGLIDKSRTLPSGSTRHGNGTSFSAPHVAGVAGLMFSFDPRLTASDVKRLLVQGAVRGNRAAGGIPILNAYESLVLAARRTGAPLCGNRVWAGGGKLYAQRDTASATGEELFSFTPDTLEASRGFNALHGGKQIMLYTQQPQALRRGRQWSPTGWTPIPFRPSSSGLANASFLSRGGLSHEGDTLVYLQRTASAPTITYRPTVAFGSTTVPFNAVITDSAYDGTPVCVATFVEVPAAQHANWSSDPAYQSWMQQYGSPGKCVFEGEPSVRVETSAYLAYAPVGQQAYAFINRIRTTTQTTGGRLCTRAQSLPTYPGAVFFYKANCLSSLSVSTTSGTTGL